MAFDMAHAGVDALQRAIDMNQNNEFNEDGSPNERYWKLDVDPARDPALDDLIKNVFAHDDIINDRVPAMSSENQYSYRQNMKNLKLRKVHSMISLGLGSLVTFYITNQFHSGSARNHRPD